MIIIINKLQIHGKRFCEKRVRGSILCNQKPGGGFALPGLRLRVRPDALSHRERENYIPCPTFSTAAIFLAAILTFSLAFSSASSSEQMV